MMPAATLERTAGTDAPPAYPRFHAFDSLRGIMMLLGVVIHTLAAYTTLDRVWWYTDPQRSHAVDAIVLFLHTFRLPVFFVMAGFFFALLVEKRTLAGAIRNRLARVGLPFLLCMTFLYPPLQVMGMWIHFRSRKPEPWAAVWSYIQHGGFAKEFHLTHFWFLYVLLILCLLAPAAYFLTRRLNLRAFLLRASDWTLHTRFGWLVWTAATVWILTTMTLGFLDTPSQLVPQFRVLLAYALFFSFGVALYSLKHRLEDLQRLAWLKTIAGVALIVPMIAAVSGLATLNGAPPDSARILLAILSGTICWLIILGSIGLFLRYAAAPSPALRYLADASYWIYLSHPAVVVPVQLTLARQPWNPFLKAALALIIAIPVLVVSYDWLVRDTWIGSILHGKRYPRGLRRAYPITTA